MVAWWEMFKHGNYTRLGQKWESNHFMQVFIRPVIMYIGMLETNLLNLYQDKKN